MNIVVINSWPADVVIGSGTAVFFNSFLSGLRNYGYHVEVIAPHFEIADYISDYVEATLNRFLFNADLLHDPRLAHADLIIGFDYDGYGLDPHRRVPFLTSAHSVHADILPWEEPGPVRTMLQTQAFFDRIAMNRSDHITIGSQYAKERIVALYGVAPDLITVIPHGQPRQPWMSFVEESKPSHDHPVILSVGRMYPRKRFGLLLEAIARLRTKYPTIELRMVGQGLEWDALHALADRLDLGKSVTWLGGVADDRAFAQEWTRADIFCHPSSQETFGYVYVEAMQLGKPIVAVRASTAPEVLGDAALLAEPEDPDSLAAALDRFLASEALRHEYSQRALLQGAQFTHERMMQGYVTVIEELTQSRSVKGS